VIAFLTSALVLTLIAIGFLVWPLVTRTGARDQRPDEVDRQAENVAAYRERLDELRTDLEAGTLDAETYQGLEAELAASLLADTSAADSAPVSPPPRERSRAPALAVLVAVLVPALAVYGYVRYGALPDVLIRDSAQVLLSGANATDDEMRALVARLERRLARAPDKSDVWYLLGHGNLFLQDYDAAADAFETLRRLTGDDTNVLVSLAQARFLADHGRVSPSTRAVMDRVLARNPHQPVVLEMLAIDAFNHQDFAAAAGYLERALAAPLSAARAADFREGLAYARAMLDRDGSASAAAANGVRIGVHVALADAVEAAPDARVFVIARDPAGPPVPIAVRALRLSDLPADFYLTDADAMQADRRLSDFASIELIARLSQSGDAAFREGDLETRSGPLDPNDDARVDLTIGP
jgi:cytochrome c-type biogenesis protein CcmH